MERFVPLECGDCGSRVDAEHPDEGEEVEVTCDSCGANATLIGTARFYRVEDGEFDFLMP